MERKIQLLDCTLRDGAYIVDSEFGAPAMRGIIKNLGEANIDVIECGWLKDKPHKPGTTFFPRAFRRFAIYRREKKECDICRHDRLGQIRSQ